MLCSAPESAPEWVRKTMRVTLATLSEHDTESPRMSRTTGSHHRPPCPPGQRRRWWELRLRLPRPSGRAGIASCVLSRRHHDIAVESVVAAARARGRSCAIVRPHARPAPTRRDRRPGVPAGGRGGRRPRDHPARPSSVTNREPGLGVATTGKPAGHRLGVRDAEPLVGRGQAEHPRTRVAGRPARRR